MPGESQAYCNHLELLHWGMLLHLSHTTLTCCNCIIISIILRRHGGGFEQIS